MKEQLEIRKYDRTQATQPPAAPRLSPASSYGFAPQPTRRQRNTPVIAAGAATKAFAIEAAQQVALAQSFLAQVIEPMAELPGNLGAVVRDQLFRCAVTHQRDAGECLGGFTAALDLPDLKTLIDELCLVGEFSLAAFAQGGQLRDQGRHFAFCQLTA